MVAPASTRANARKRGVPVTSVRKIVNARSSGAGAIAPRGRATAASSATKDAWRALTDVVRAGKTQPVAAMRASGRAVRNVARTSVEQTSVAADTIANAAEAVLVAAMDEVRVAARAARDSARDVERSADRALRAIRRALRQRAHAAIDSAMQKRVAPKKTPSRRRTRRSAQPGKERK